MNPASAPVEALPCAAISVTPTTSSRGPLPAPEDLSCRVGTTTLAAATAEAAPVAPDSPGFGRREPGAHRAVAADRTPRLLLTALGAIAAAALRVAGDAAHACLLFPRPAVATLLAYLRRISAKTSTIWADAIARSRHATPPTNDPNLVFITLGRVVSGWRNDPHTRHLCDPHNPESSCCRAADALGPKILFR
jgi:hypothetical protein